MHAWAPASWVRDATVSKRRVRVRRSRIHGRGLFARTDIAAGELFLEYAGMVVRWDDVPDDGPGAAGHTFLFDLGDGWVIDGGRGGNSARWINHGCEPNCDAVLDGHQVWIRATRDIGAGEELLLDYQLHVDDGMPDQQHLYACDCGAPSCRATMLAETG
jgi:SET domain-containing protein